MNSSLSYIHFHYIWFSKLCCEVLASGYNFSMENHALKELSIPRWEELPDLDLYMDQVLSYINSRLEPLSIGEEKTVLTSSMVNNYVKTNIVKPPVKKHYKRYHLAYLFVVMLMKRCFSLSEIGDLIRIYSDIENPERIARDYNKFVSVFESSLRRTLKEGSDSQIYFEKPNPEQILMLSVIHTLTSKIYAQAGIQEHKARERNEGIPG